MLYDTGKTLFFSLNNIRTCNLTFKFTLETNLYKKNYLNAYWNNTSQTNTLTLTKAIEKTQCMWQMETIKSTAMFDRSFNC